MRTLDIGTLELLCAQMITMFELTFENWVPVDRLLADSTNRVVWILILFDVIAVNFDIVRVISGMLLHETLKLLRWTMIFMCIQKERSCNRNRTKMEVLFRETDNISVIIFIFLLVIITFIIIIIVIINVIPP